MKLLIVTQVVDQGDSNLGFFVRWIEEFAKHIEHIEIICLSQGSYTLPENVRVQSLGKEKEKRSALVYALKFILLAWKLRNKYDTVFVHMNPEYFVIAGLLWRILRKKTALWYTHKSVTFSLRIAAFFADIIFTASKESFRLQSKKVRVMGHGIDTELFTPDPDIVRGSWWLSAGRLSRSKRHDLIIKQVAAEGKELRIAGDGPERKDLQSLANSLKASVVFLGSLTQTQLRDEYRKSGLFVHTSETGSLDKVVLEALACGLPIKTNDPGLKFLEHEGPAYVRTEHSLTALIPRIINLLS